MKAHAHLGACANGVAWRRGRMPEKDMSTLSSTAAQASTSGWGGFLDLIREGANALLIHLERRAAIKTLHELDDRALRDIGIVRCQIEAAVGGALNPDMGRLQ